MKKYLITFSKSLKAELSYRSAMLAGIASALLGFVIQLFLWQALLGTGIRQDTSFSDMVLYILINSFMLELTRSNVATTIETAMIDGTVSMELLRPMSYKYYLLASIFGKNFYSALTRTVPIVIVGLFFLSPNSCPSPVYMGLFGISALLGVLLLFEVTYVVGLLAFWIQRCWFLSWYLRGFQTFFGGTAVPLWFYPDALNTVGYFLPFRYMTFEPVNFFLQKTPLSQAAIPLLAAALWLVGLSLLDRLMWRAAMNRLAINGG